MASAQLQLIHTDHTWKLDRHTVEVGRAGIARARAALEAATELSDSDGQPFDYKIGRIDDKTAEPPLDDNNPNAGRRGARQAGHRAVHRSAA